jgi:predicted DCC family thiol-disulfide oxidoreductase YuxK
VTAAPGDAPSAPERAGTAGEARAVIFFDGVCGLCNRLVQFVLARDGAARFRFAPLQGGFARRELVPRGGRPDDLDTMAVLTPEGELLERSRAVLFILRELGGLWKVLSGLRVLPVALTDRAYDLVARSRYRVFGRLDACRVPGPAERDRFIEG